jgi:carbamoyltransferase
MIVLGLSFFYHDAAAALVVDGDLAAAAEEERFNRKKHCSDFPIEAVNYCLRQAGITIDDVDYVVFYEKPLQKFERILLTSIAAWPKAYLSWCRSVPLWLKTKLHIPKLIRKTLETDHEVLFCDHHLAHAGSSFLVSPYESAAILTADGVGEWTTTAYGIGKGNEIEFYKEIRFPHSVGLLFSAITAYLGFKVNDAEWKVMGLAPYGEPKYVDKFHKVVDVRDDGSMRLNLDYFSHTYSTYRMFNRKWENLFGQPQRNPESDLTQFHKDIARSGQAVVEEIMVKIAKHIKKETGEKYLCIGGGVGLNSVANWQIFQEAGFEDIFIQPAAGDAGGALGAAFFVYNSLLDKPRKYVMKNAYLGPEFSDEEIRQTLDRFNAKYEYAQNQEELLDKTARLIADNKVIGWFQGRMEFGPRALGSRSILASAGSEKMKELINSKVKYREWFRPFAPAVLKEKAPEYFEMPEGLDLPFMLMVPKVRPEKRDLIPAVTHEDGTGRVQTVTKEQNGIYYDLIKRYEQLSGVPVVINTSFNVRGEPIVCTPLDAYRTFVNTGIDALVIGSFIVTQKPSDVDFELGMQRSIQLEKGAESLVM